MLQVQAQKKMSKDELVKLMSKDVCDELDKIVNEKKSVQNLEVELGMAMLPVFTKYEKEISEVYGFSDLTSENGEKIGRDIGGNLARTCPSFMKILTSNVDQTTELISGDKKTRATLKGDFIKLTTGELSFIEVKAGNGKVEKLYWLEYFEGSNDLANNASKFNNKTVNVGYTEKEIYKAAIKDYVKMKIITSLALDK